MSTRALRPALLAAPPGAAPAGATPPFATPAGAAASAPCPAAALSPRLFGLVLAGLLLRVCLSANLLAWLGIPYAQDGGNPLVKIHPGTYAVLLALGAEARRGPLWSGGRVRPFLFLAALFLCALFGLAAIGPSGLAVYVDSYFCAGALALLLARASAAQRRSLGRALFAALVLSAALALGETFAGAHLVPHMAEIVEQIQAHPEEFRGLGLHDHPLVGALASMVALFLLPALGLPRPVAWGGGLVLALSLLAFGGRAALAVTALAALFEAARCLAARAASRRLGPGTLLAALTLPPLLGALAWVLAGDTPLGQRLMLHLAVDDSVLARGAPLQVLGALDWRQALFGTSIDELRQILYQLSRAVPFTEIENFWLATLVSLGAFGFVVLLAGFLPFLLWLWRWASRRGRLILTTGLVVASASNTLARKSDVLVLLVAAVLATARPPPGSAAEPGARPLRPGLAGAPA